MIPANWNNKHEEQSDLLMLEGICVLPNALPAPEKERELLRA